MKNENAKRIWNHARHPTKKALVVASTMTLLVAIGVVAATALLTQTIPGNTFPGTVITGCATVSSDLSAGASGNSSNTAWLVLNCGTTPAFQIHTAGSYTPTFGTGSGETDIYMIPATSTGAPTSTPSTGCGDFTGGHILTSGATVTGLLAGSTWDYCLDSTPGASLSSFTVGWG